MRKLFLIHKWLGLFFSLPLFVMAVTGFILSIAPVEVRGGKEAPPSSLPVHEILTQQKKLYPRANFMRASFNPGEVTLMMREKDVRVLKISRRDGSILSSIKPTDDFFILNKIIHESFLLSGFGKKLVAISGIGLALILISGMLFWMRNQFQKQFFLLFRTESFQRVKPFHLLIGVIFFLPLLFSSISGALIEYNGIFFNDRPSITHVKPETCEWTDIANVLKSRATGPGGMIMFCRPDHPYISVSGRDGFRQYTPSDEEVLFVPKEDWSGQRGTRKHWFVHWHGGENFGPFEFTYQLLTSLPLLILVVTGLIMWFRKKRKT